MHHVEVVWYHTYHTDPNLLLPAPLRALSLNFHAHLYLMVRMVGANLIS